MRRKIPKVIEKKLGRQRIMGADRKTRIIGYAEYDKNLISIDPRQSPKEYFDTLTHEAVHFAFPEFDFPDVTEKEVIRAGRLISKILWRAGYRKISQ